jgi:hypothetical protein
MGAQQLACGKRGALGRGFVGYHAGIVFVFGFTGL